MHCKDSSFLGYDAVNIDSYLQQDTTILVNSGLQWADQTKS
jgi:hypothetical protein